MCSYYKNYNIFFVAKLTFHRLIYVLKESLSLPHIVGAPITKNKFNLMKAN